MVLLMPYLEIQKITLIIQMKIKIPEKDPKLDQNQRKSLSKVVYLMISSYKKFKKEEQATTKQQLKQLKNKIEKENVKNCLQIKYLVVIWQIQKQNK